MLTSLRKLIPATFALSSILLMLAASAFAQKPTLVRVSTDPFTDPTSQHASEVEPVLVVNGNTIVAAFQVGRFLGAGADDVGWATSTDAGLTWQNGFLSGTTTFVGGGFKAVSLPTIAYDQKHGVYLISMMPFDHLGNGRGILVSRSADGLKWSKPIKAASSSSLNGHSFTCDNSTTSPYYGNCYDAYFDLTQVNSGIFLNDMVTSSDGGLTWSAPVIAPDQEAGLVSSMVTQPNGTVVILGRNGGINGDQQYAIRSTDGGQTLEPTNDVATIYFDYPYLRADPNQAAAVDSNGTIYDVFPDCRFRSNCSDPVAVSACRYVTDNTACPPNDFVMTTSTDGITWTPPQRIPIDGLASNVDHLIGGFGLLPSALANRSPGASSGPTLALAYYYLPNGRICSPDACRVAAGFISSPDGGVTWHNAVAVSDPMPQSWLVPTYAGNMVADYVSAVFVNGQPFSAFAIARHPNPKTGNFNEAIYTVALP